MIRPVKGIPLETVLVPDHHPQDLFESFFRDIEGVVEESQRSDGADVAESIQLTFDKLNRFILVLPGPLRETTERARERTRLRGAERHKLADLVTREESIINHV